MEEPGHEMSTQSVLAPHSLIRTVYISMQTHMLACEFVRESVIVLKARACTHIHTHARDTHKHGRAWVQDTQTHAHVLTNVNYARKGIRGCACTRSSPVLVHAYKHLIPFVCLMHKNEMHRMHTYIYVCIHIHMYSTVFV